LASPISNFVSLAPGVPVELHFKDHGIMMRMITDPIRKVAVQRETLMMYVDRENGVGVDKVYSVLSQKHASELAGYLPGKNYVNYLFTVQKDAPGTVPPRIVKVAPR